MSVQENLVTLMVNLGQYEKQTYLISSLYITLEHNSKVIFLLVILKNFIKKVLLFFFSTCFLISIVAFFVVSS
jgi:hypothetical protein